MTAPKSQRTIVLLRASGEREEIPMAKMPTVEEIQGWVGGYFEEVHVMFEGKRCYMFINEDGRERRLPMNRAACELEPTMMILGDVAILTYRKK